MSADSMETQEFVRLHTAAGPLDIDVTATIRDGWLGEDTLAAESTAEVVAAIRALVGGSGPMIRRDGGLMVVDGPVIAYEYLQEEGY